MVTEDQHRAVQRLALQVLACVSLDGPLEEDRKAAVRGLRQNLGAARVTAPIHRPTDMHPTKKEIEQC